MDDHHRDAARGQWRGRGRIICGLRRIAVTPAALLQLRHETSAADSAGTTLDWIDARFARTPAPSDCGRI